MLAVVEQSNSYQAGLVEGIRSVIRPTGRALILVARDPLFPGSGLIARVLLAIRPEGVLTTALADPASDAALDRVLATAPGTTTVWLGAAREGRSTTVCCDNTTGMRELVRHLVTECGVRRPALVRGVRHHNDSIERDRVVRATFAEFGVPVDEGLCVDGEFQRGIAHRAVTELLTRRRDLDAVVAFNDRSALGAIDALNQVGLRVPDDVVVSGFDDEDLAAMSVPALTTVNQQVVEQGAEGARRLLAAMAGRSPGPSSSVVATRLVIRQSTLRTAPAPSPRSAQSSTDDPGGRVWSELTARDTALALTRSLISCRTIEAAVAALAGALARLAVTRCFVVLLDQPPVPGDPPRARVVLAYRDGRVQDLDGGTFDLASLLPPTLAAELDGFLTVQPLSTERGELGYLLLEHAEPDRLVGEAVRMDLSRTLDTLARESALAEHAGSLERLVAERTRELAAQAATRAAAQEQLAVLNAELRSRLHVDGLTGICNRIGFDARLAGQWLALSRANAPLSLLMIDVDYFKRYNDALGHLAGDQCLRTLAGCLREVVRGTDQVAARFGGEEFAVVLPGVAPSLALTVAGRVRSALAAADLPHPRSPHGRITVSIGVATRHPDPGPNSTTLVADADVALYAAKAAGRDRVVAAEGGVLSG